LQPPKSHILIIDDVPDNIRVLGEALMADNEIRFATSGAEGLSMIRTPPLPDLILLDIMMPDMDGYEVFQQIQSDPSIRHIPVIFLTAKASDQDELKGFDIGAVDYITKPFNSRIVGARVKTHLELKRYRDHLDYLVTLRTEALFTANSQLQQELEKGRQTEDILRQNEQLLAKSNKSLEETNTALKIVLNQISQDKQEMAGNIMASINKTILPTIEKIRGKVRDSQVHTWLNMLQSNLNTIVSPFAQKLTSGYYRLSGTEIEVANLIKNAKTTKEIASLLNISHKTVEFHRNNIRSKLGIKNRPINLRSYLIAMK